MTTDTISRKTSKKAKDTERHRQLFDIELVSPVSAEALAAGEVHNAIYSRFEEIFEDRRDPVDKIIAAIRHAELVGCISNSEEKVLTEIVKTLDPELPDFGLERVRALRRRLIDDRSGDIAIATASVAVSTTELGLSTVGDTGPQAARRRRWVIALFDIGGAILGGAIGGVGGAVAGGGIASSIAQQSLPNN